MLDEKEYLLTVLAEECSEAAQRASKAIRFGLEEIQPGQNDNNTRRLERELAEVIAIAELLGLKIHEEDKIAKIKKFQKYADYSKFLGRLG